MKKQIIMWICLILPVSIHAQQYSEIKFSNAKNWLEVLNEAKSANKPIFVDAYTTWCIPCKRMDKEVYTDKAVADFMNANFIAVKVQMDTTTKDNDYVKGWRDDAAKWKLYATSFPSYLFYASDGKYLGKETGFHVSEDFLVLLKKAIDPEGSYVAQIDAYKAGKLNQTQLLALCHWAKNNKDDSVANEVAQQYKKKYIDNEPVDSILNPEGVKFLSSFLNKFTFSDAIIKYMYENPKLADKRFAMWAGFSNGIIDFMIRREYINPIIVSNGAPREEEPDWNELQNSIEKKFDKLTSQKAVLNAQVSLAFAKKQWDRAVALEFKRINAYGMDTTLMGKIGLNNLVYSYAFKYINDKSLLMQAAELMKRVVTLDRETESSHLDTYASVLYKAGEKKKAIEVEKKALNLAVDRKDSANIKYYTDMISKMNAGEQIWKE